MGHEDEGHNAAVAETEPPRPSAPNEAIQDAFRERDEAMGALRVVRSALRDLLNERATMEATLTSAQALATRQHDELVLRKGQLRVLCGGAESLLENGLGSQEALRATIDGVRRSLPHPMGDE